MKFWQKTFICVLVCFLAGFDIAAVLIIRRNQAISREKEIGSVLNEVRVITKSISERLNSVSGNYTEFNADNIAQYIHPYADYYFGQGIFFILKSQGSLLFSNFEGEIPSGQDYAFTQVGDVEYLAVNENISVDDYTFTFSYIKDESWLGDYLRETTGYTVRVGTVVSLVLSAVLIFLLLRLTKPISLLNRAAGEIANGDYHKRVKVNSRDEIGAFSDIFNSMAESVETHIRQLSFISEEKQRFIDNLSHEMRTPIAAILGYGDLLKNAGITPDEQLLSVNYIINQSLRLQNLSSKLLQLASMTEGAIKMERLKISGVIDNALNTLRNDINEKGILVLKAPELKGISVEGDADLLESLFQNLLENAVRVLDEGGHLKITACYNVSGGGTFVSIKDNGPGMSEEECAKIMEPFYRVDKARSRTNGGAGLGLSVCKRICDIHNAELEVLSQPGEGTAVRILFTTR